MSKAEAVKQKTVLTDDDLMPATVYKGHPMKDVPYEFLLWLDAEAKPIFRRKFPALMKYIEDNKQYFLIEQKQDPKNKNPKNANDD